MKKVYIILIVNPVSEEVKLRSVYATKEKAMRAFKYLEKLLTDKKNPLGYDLTVAECHPNFDDEFVPFKTLATAGI